MTKKSKNAKVAQLYNVGDYQREIPVLKEHEYRSPFRRDYARLVHSPAFRRLQGKTQLFPGIESDFFRNRLTHSMEVAQIAKSIALSINSSSTYFKKQNLNTDLVEMAALAHDLGHPPFGHNGEHALDVCMYEYGGFEGNAQTLRIVAKLEKKEKPDSKKDELVGLNFTHRSLGALLKYDTVIPITNVEREDHKDKLVKGYYDSESALITNAKRSMLGGAEHTGNFKTIECSIMDIADDIAYSTYDLEDAFKAGFANPLEVLRYAHDPVFLDKIVEKVAKFGQIAVNRQGVYDILISTFGGFIVEKFKAIDLKKSDDLISGVVDLYRASKLVASDGFTRTELTSALVDEFVCGIHVELNPQFPVLSTLKIDASIRTKIEVLKHFTYVAFILSPRLKIVEHRGKEIVTALFHALTEKGTGHLLLPDDFRDSYHSLKEVRDRMRLVCDFIAGMTDRYAIEFYGRLTSVDHGQSFYKPL